MNNIWKLCLVAATAFVFGCGPRAFVKGQYDDNVEDNNLLDDRWSETDMQKAVKDLVGEAVAHPTIAAAKRRPIVMVTRLQNKTSEVIDTQNITDMFQVELQNSGKVQFVDKAAREGNVTLVTYETVRASLLDKQLALSVLEQAQAEGEIALETAVGDWLPNNNVLQQEKH